MVMRLIKNLFFAPKCDWAPSTLAPDARFYVIGDVHGRLDLLEQLLPELDTNCPVVFVGDYIDRGENSAQVLRLVHELSNSQREFICLLGNHEEMLLGFLDDPHPSAAMWLRNGGAQTLASFGISDETVLTDGAEKIADRLRSEMGETLLSWLQDRPLVWTNGNVNVVHAALDPGKPVGNQSRQTCLWGHRQFPQRQRKDGQWVIHGHTIVTDPAVANGVISVDTGAFATNILTAAEVSHGQVRFLCTDRAGVIRL